MDNGKTRLVNTRLPIEMVEALDVLATLGGTRFSKVLAEMVRFGVQHLKNVDELRFVRMEAQVTRLKLERVKRREEEIEANNAVVEEQDEKALLHRARMDRDRAKAELAKLEEQREAERALAGVPGMSPARPAPRAEDDC